MTIERGYSLTALQDYAKEHYKEALSCAKIVTDDQAIFDDDAPCFQKLAKAYNIPRPKIKSRGLGDVISKTLKFLKVDKPIKVAITKVTGKPCNCDERKEVLNELVPL